MSFKRTLSITLQVAAVLVVASLIVGQYLGQPILLSYVETGSMQPVLNPGDGFVAIPTPIAGGIGVGDVVTFDAQEIEGGGLTTHRVVEETERGYITRGTTTRSRIRTAASPSSRRPTSSPRRSRSAGAWSSSRTSAPSRWGSSRRSTPSRRG